MSTTFEFDASDGTHIQLECNEKFLQFVRDKIGLLQEETITAAHVRLVFMQTIRSATSEA